MFNIIWNQMKKQMLVLLLFIATIGYSQDWKTDFNSAKQEATVSKQTTCY